MLEKPDISDAAILSCLQEAFGLDLAHLTFLPLGADLDTAVYRATTANETAYFVKLRRGSFDQAAVAVPKFLSDQGLRQIIPPLPTLSGQLWANFGPDKLILYPFVVGQNGFQVKVSDRQRVELGAALKRLHTAQIPAALTHGVRREDFSPRWREMVTAFLAHLEDHSFTDSVAVETAVFLQSKHAETQELLHRAAALARLLQAQPPPFTLCHGDIHGWNLLLNEGGNLYIVDWDTLVFAPKERDLMFVGCGLGGNGHTLQEEERLFYQGYGQTEVNAIALAYYRYERIVEDIAVECQQIFHSDEGGEDHIQALAYLQSNYAPGGAIEMAYQTDKTGIFVS